MLQLQSRDLALLVELGEYGMLDTTTIHRRHWPEAKTPRASQQRLKQLVEAGFLKPASLKVVHARNGRVPCFYLLTP